MKKERIMSEERREYCRKLYIGMLWMWGAVTVLLVAYGAYAVLAALIPVEDLSTGVTDTGLKVGLSTLPINLGRGIPYWAIPRSGDLAGAANWIWFWNILCVMLWEILPIWFLLFWGKGFLRECTPAAHLEQKRRENDGPGALDVSGWDPIEHIWSRKNGRRLLAAGIMLLLIGLFKRTLWLLILSVGVYGAWDFCWNQDMIEFTTCTIGMIFILFSVLWKKRGEREELCVKGTGISSEPGAEEED